MIFPPGVFQHFSPECLMAKNEQAYLQIDTEVATNNLQYEIEHHSFDDDIAPYLHGIWSEFDEQYKLWCDPDRIVYETGEKRKLPVIYSRAIHNGQPKLPDITVLSNLWTKKSPASAKSYKVLGSSMGQYYPPCIHTHETLRIYEAHSYCLFVVGKDTGRIELWVAERGDKIAVHGGDRIALTNLGDEHNHLIALDFGCPEYRPLRDSLAEKYGPLLLAFYNDFEVIFQFNKSYAITLAGKEDIEPATTPTAEDNNSIAIKRSSRLPLGRMLHEKLTTDPAVIGEFARLGLYIRKASPEVILRLSSQSDVPLYFSKPLTNAIKGKTDVSKYFLQEAEPETPEGNVVLLPSYSKRQTLS